jgi:hypothetical protein
LQTIRRHPIFILLAVNILIGLFIFRDYGLSWDEPLFYDYAHALGYAYSPKEWFSGNFNLENAYGASGTDHANRGPAYLLLAREPVYLLEALGIYFLYRFGLRWLKPWSAFAAAALFSTQPLLWGHAFINPKDPPFLAFFLASVCLGFEMVDKWTDDTKNNKQKILSIIFPATVLGITTSIRVLGPLAGLLVAVYALQITHCELRNISSRSKAGAIFTAIKKNFSLLFAYAFIALLTMFLSWPYLWPDPIARFIEVFRFMSDNPTQLAVLFNGQLYQADELPRRYLPVLLGSTLTEPVWFLFIIGLILSIRNLITNHLSPIINYWSLVTERSLILLWFAIPFLYVIICNPPNFDGYRHFLFMLPPVFIFAGFAFENFHEKIRSRWINITITLLILLPGVISAVQLHPFEYAYYNSFIGGTGGAFRSYETDYWLTCYKEATEQFNAQSPQDAKLFVKREAYIAANYASPNISIHDYRTKFKDIQSGDFILVNTRANEDLKTFKDAPPIIQIKRMGATFCTIKRVP